MSSLSISPVSLYLMTPEGGEGTQRGRLWSVIPYKAKHPRRHTWQCSGGRKITHLESARALWKPSHPQNQVFLKRTPRQISQFFKSCVTAFHPSHGENAIFNSSRSAWLVFTTGGLGRRRETREVAYPADETGKEARSWWDRKAGRR